jgi:hypothetical protein
MTTSIRPKSSASILALMLGSALLASACSPSRIVASSLGNALAEDSLVYAGDDDVELVGAATPFGLKTMETLLAEVPRHRRLLTAAARGFTQYAYVYVQLPADELEERDVAAAYEARARARRLYLRARAYGLRALRLDDDDSLAALQTNPRRTLARVKARDLEALYWTGVAWSAAIALGKDDPDLIGGLPVVDAMIARAAALDPDFDDGGLHTFLISWEMAQPGADERAADVAGRHFRRAVELSEGKRVAPFVAMAESVSVLRNQRRAFEDYLSRAIAIDADSRAEWRLANHVMQRRAQWLLARADMYFLE